MTEQLETEDEHAVELWNLDWPTGVTAVQFAQFGAQAKTAALAAKALDAYRPLFALEDGPVELNRGAFEDAASYSNALFIAYWIDMAAYDRWTQHAAVQAFWAARSVDSEIGYWQELVRAPTERIDTLYTPDDPVANDQPGVAQHGKMGVCQAHGYWGAARDRIRASKQDDFAAELAVYEPTTQDTLGRRLSVTVPGNVCIARHHEDWRKAEVFGDLYLDNVAGIKEAGVKHLERHPELGCVSAREISGQDLDGNAIKSANSIACFLSLSHLEHWTRADPSHLSIHDAFLAVAAQMKPGQTWDVPMWHEVYVIPAGSAQADYINCHNRTGFLTLLDSQSSTAN
jgi:hypothetical protein